MLKIFCTIQAVVYTNLASGYTIQHILSPSPSPKIGSVEVGKTSGIKILRGAWLDFSAVTIIIITIFIAIF